MKRNSLIVLVLLVVVVGVFLFFLMLPSFESEYARMRRVWENRGVDAEFLHSSEQVFSLSESELESMKDELVSLKGELRTGAARELVGVYGSFLDFAKEYAVVSGVQASLSESNASMCENISKYEEVNEKLSLLKEKKNNYLNAVNSFVEKYPEKAKSISLYKSELPKESESLEALSAAVSVLKGECE